MRTTLYLLLAYIVYDVYIRKDEKKEDKKK